MSDDVDSGTFNADTWSLEATLASVGVYNTPALFVMDITIYAGDNTVQLIGVG